MFEKMIVNGELVAADGLTLPALSRGFAFGFGVFETVKFVDSTPCFFSEHVARLRKAADGAGLELAYSEEELLDHAKSLFRGNDLSEGVFKIVVSDVGVRPMVAVFVRSQGTVDLAQPVRLTVSSVAKSSQAFTSRHKTTNYMESTLELEKAKAAGFDECVFINEHGQVTECAIANLFWARNGTLFTPDLRCGLLDGIVRAQLLEIAAEMGVQTEVGAFGLGELVFAEEAFISSSGAGLRAVESFTDLVGVSTRYGSNLMYDLRERFRRRERESVGRTV